MAEQDSNPSTFPLANIATLIVLIGGIAFYLAPLTSSRPSAEPGHEVTPWGNQDVDARLWQDPFEASDKHAQEIARVQDEPTKRAEGRAHGMETVREEITHAVGRRRCDSGANCPPTILAIMVPGSPYAEEVERRLRARHAVVEGLSASDFTPKDYLHVGYFQIYWPSDPSLLHSGTEPTEGRPLLVPYEWYERREDNVTVANELLVVWLRDDAFAEQPLTRLAWLLGSMNGSLSPASPPTPQEENTGGRPAMAIIGPATSNDLRTMVEEEIPSALQVGLRGTEMYSASASASDQNILHQRETTRPKDPPSEETSLSVGKIPEFHFQRTILDDRYVMKELVKELQQRDVWSGGTAHIVLLAQLDTVYGRSLPKEFEYEVADPSIPGKRPFQLETFLYPEGIDGKIPTDGTEDDQTSKPKPQPEQLDARPQEVTEGADQSDYLRRLAAKLKDEDTAQRSQGEGGIKAVGVLGADVFDKIMILRALRRSLPDAVFFTNGIDARLAHPSEWDATHNLVVASAYGLELNGSGLRGSYPPFRDGYETSIFAATLRAMHQQVPDPSVHLYEIGLQGPFPLDAPQGGHLLGRARLTWPLLVLTPIVALFLGCWGRQAWRNNGSPLLPEWKDFLVETPLFLVPALAAIALLIAVAQWKAVGGGEPVALFDGVSVWPSEALRLLVALLGVHFIFKSMEQIRLSNDRVEKLFYAKRLASAAPPTASDAKAFAETWRQHVEQGWFRRRLGRIWLPLMLYVAFAICVMYLLGPPATPARGIFAQRVNLVIISTASLVTSFLLFFVIDAMLLNQRFVNKIMESTTQWSDDLLDEYRPPKAAEPPIDACLAELLDIKAIAERTAAIEPLIYYPFILLALMILSRLHYFDNWDFPLSLSVVFTLNAAGAVFAARTLRQSAEYAREKALEKLRRRLFDAGIEKESPHPEIKAAAAGQAVAARQAIDEIKAVRTGAFGSFAENPVLGALLLPGGAGLIAIAPYLLVPH
jgi:hypothetical protein